MQTILIDDSDTSDLTYTGQWTESGNSNEYNSTTHGSSTAGSVVTFQFNGSGVQVFGTIGPSSGDGIPSTTYVLDSFPPVIYTAANSPSAPIYRQPFYTSPNLTNGEHKLTVTVQPGGQYWLDYFLFTTTSASSGPARLDPLSEDGATASSTTSDNQSPSHVATSGASQYPDVQISGSSTAIPANTLAAVASGLARPTSPSPAAFVGLAVLSTILVFAFLVGAWFIWRRRSPQRVEHSDGPPDLELEYGKPTVSTFRPLVLPSFHTSSQYSVASRYSPTFDSYTSPTSPSRRSSARATILSSAALPRSVSTYTSSDHDQQRTLLPGHHTDGGIRIGTARGIPHTDMDFGEELPPAYGIHRTNVILREELVTHVPCTTSDMGLS